MSLDIRTAAISSAMVFFVVFLVFLISSRESSRPFPGERTWAWGFGLVSLCQLVIGLRGLLPAWFSIAAGNSLGVAALALLAAGTELFLDRHPRYPIYLAAVLLCLAFAIVFGILVPDALWRVAGMNIASAGILVWGGSRIRGLGTGALGTRVVWASKLEFLVAALFLARTATFPWIDRHDWLKSPWPEFLALILIYGSLLGLAFTFDRLVAFRLRAELDSSLKAREFLLREMHHRTKNELALVQSLLRLESSSSSSSQPGLAERLEVVGARVRSIGLVHDSLSRLGAVKEVRLDDYLRLVAESLSTGESLRRIETSLAPVSIDSSRAVSVGLIVTELALNALLHAFPDGRPGRVRISLALRGEAIVVGVGDDGVGFEPGIEHEGFGTLLVESLASQLQGHLTRGYGPGSCFELGFPLAEAGRP